jgi:hypothetical protein
MIQRLKDVRVLAVCSVLCLGAGYWYWMPPSATLVEERDEMAAFTPAVVRGVEVPHAEVVKMYGSTLRKLGAVYPGTMKTGAWTSWGSPPLRYSSVEQVRDYEEAELATIAVVAPKLHWMRGTRTADIGEPVPWSALIEVVEIVYGPGASRIDYQVRWSDVGGEKWGTCPSNLKPLVVAPTN